MLLGLFTDALLLQNTSYQARLGIWLMPVSCAVLILAMNCLQKNWLPEGTQKAAWGLAVLFWLNGVYQVLRLWKILRQLYPDSTSLFWLVVMLVLPSVYLKSKTALARISYVIFLLLTVACIVMVVSLLPRLKLENLQFPALTAENGREVLFSQLMLYPELILAAIMKQDLPDKEKPPGRLALFVLLLEVGEHILLELFFGAVMERRSVPLHTAVQSGTFSIFNRMEWLLVLLTVMAVSVRLAMLAFAGKELRKIEKEKKDLLPCGKFYDWDLFAFGITVLVLKEMPLERLRTFCFAAGWGMWLWVVLKGEFVRLSARLSKKG